MIVKNLFFVVNNRKILSLIVIITCIIKSIKNENKKNFSLIGTFFYCSVSLSVNCRQKL